MANVLQQIRIPDTRTLKGRCNPIFKYECILMIQKNSNKVLSLLLFDNLNNTESGK